MPALVTIIAGLFAVYLLFWRHPTLRDERKDAKKDGGRIGKAKEGKTIESDSTSALPRISVVIPARNEENNLPLVLADLQSQDFPAYEIICVDDASEDRTAEIIETFGVQHISVEAKPKDWIGKSWACQIGADKATGDVLLFLDADVRMSVSALRMLAESYVVNKSVLSVQPYHSIDRIYEHFSLFFSLVLLAANGLGFPLWRRNIGLFGPVILVSRKVYLSIDGHCCAKKSIVDDLAIGETLRKKGIRLELFMGGKDISFRMYSGGFRDLCQGWIKNFATGASKTPIHLILLIVLWFGGSTSVVIELIIAVSQGSLSKAGIFLGMYFVWAISLWLISRKAGNFRAGAFLLYPVFLVFFFGLFLVSLFKKIFGRTVTWKGRKIKT